SAPGAYSPTTMILVSEPSSVVPTVWARTTPSTSPAAATTSSACGESATTNIGCDSPGGKCSETTSRPAADSDCTRNFSTWVRPIEVPNQPAAMIASTSTPPTRLNAGRADTRAATPCQKR